MVLLCCSSAEVLGETSEVMLCRSAALRAVPRAAEGLAELSWGIGIVTGAGDTRGTSEVWQGQGREGCAVTAVPGSGRLREVLGSLSGVAGLSHTWHSGLSVLLVPLCLCTPGVCPRQVNFGLSLFHSLFWGCADSIFEGITVPISQTCPAVTLTPLRLSLF